MKRFNTIKKSRKRSKDIDEKIEYLNKECQKTGLQEVMMTTTDMYFATQDNPAVDAVIAEVPDSTGVLGSGFTPPIGGNGDPNDPSNFPDAYDNSWMFNSNDVDGVSGRPIIASLDDKIFQDYATARDIALPGSQNPYPSGGAGIAFGSPAFGTAVGYIHGGHFKQILVGGLVGGTELVPADATGPPFYGMGTIYFPAYDHDISMWKVMTAAYVPLRDRLARGEIGTIPVMAWKRWNSFHDQPWDDIPITNKYIGNGIRYVLSGFNVFAAANNYEKTPAIPASTTILYKSNLGDPTFLPIDIEGISPQAFDYLKDKAGKGTDVASNVNYDLYNYLDKRYGIEASNWYENNPTLPHESNPFIPPREAPYLPLASNPNDSRFSEPVSDIEIPGLGAKPGDELAFGGFGGGNNKPITKKSDFGPIKKSTAIKDANFSIMGMGLSPEAFKKKYGISPQDFLNLPESKTDDKKYLEEGVKLGHFDPEVLNVNIDDLRKGIMPEFPKDPPPEMIGGYSAKSRLVRKEPELPPFINVTKKDLARSHKLTDKEISDFMNDIKMINDYIKKNPAELKYAMIRYPKNDPRLAQLNFKMDQMKAASDEYMDTHFPENQKLFNKLQDKIIRNINQTDPKNFKGHKEAPKFTDEKTEVVEQRKKTVLKYFKKPVKIKKPFKY